MRSRIGRDAKRLLGASLEAIDGLQTASEDLAWACEELAACAARIETMIEMMDKAARPAQEETE